MPSPNDASATDLPHDDAAGGARYLAGGWDPVAGVWRALKSFGDRSLLVLFAKGTTITQAAVSVGTTTVSLVAANPGRKVVTFYNQGPATAYLKTTTPAAAATDYPLPPGAEFEDKHTVGAWYAITASGFADVRLRETV